MLDAYVLLDDLNAYRRKTAHYAALAKKAGVLGLPDLKGTPARLKALEAMAGWCFERELDPRLWLYALFVAKAWRLWPTEREYTSERVLDVYRRMPDWGLAAERLRASQAKTASATAAAERPNLQRDLVPVVETRKRIFAQSGQAKACFDGIVTSTYGYHPLSPVCTACALAGPCKRRLQALFPFDIVALRQGATVPVVTVQPYRAGGGTC